jgi:hypothetical protein
VLAALGLYAGERTTASTETICAGTRSLAGAPPASKDPFYPPAQIVCGLVVDAEVRGRDGLDRHSYSYSSCGDVAKA